MVNNYKCLKSRMRAKIIIKLINVLRNVLYILKCFVKQIIIILGFIIHIWRVPVKGRPV